MFSAVELAEGACDPFPLMDFAPKMVLERQEWRTPAQIEADRRADEQARMKPLDGIDE